MAVSQDYVSFSGNIKKKGSKLKILSVRMVDGKLEIQAKVAEDRTDHDGEIMSGIITWYYMPPYRGHPEHVDSDVLLENPIGELITGLLMAERNRLELDDDSAAAVIAMEEIIS